VVQKWVRLIKNGVKKKFVIYGIPLRIRPQRTEAPTSDTIGFNRLMAIFPSMPPIKIPTFRKLNIQDVALLGQNY